MSWLLQTAVEAVKNNAFAVICFLGSLPLIAFFLIIDYVKRNHRYVSWKKQTLNLFIYTREWERTDDQLLQQLFDENQRLETELKAVKGEYKRLNRNFTFTLIGIGLALVWYGLKNSIKSKLGLKPKVVEDELNEVPTSPSAISSTEELRINFPDLEKALNSNFKKDDTGGV